MHENAPLSTEMPKTTAQDDALDLERWVESAAHNRLASGLHLVSTPIGNASDITLRALRVLRDADVIAAEDTRTARRLMDIHGIQLAGRKMIPYHDHSSDNARNGILALVAEGKSVALVSEAGTPAIADPGFKLVAQARAEELPVTAAPGVSAAITAMCLSGLPTDRFTFAGFAPAKSAARKRFLQSLSTYDGCLVLYESPRRLADCLRDACEIFDPERDGAVCRELTKKFEEIRRGTLAELAQQYADESTPKGEIVLVIGPGEANAQTQPDIESLLRAALENASLKDAVREVTRQTGKPRKEVYQLALQITN